MPITTALLLKLAASAGTATLSKLLENDEGGPAQALNSVFGGVATNFIHQYTDKLDYNALSNFISQEAGGDYKELNHDIEKLMLASVPKTFKLLKKTYQREFDTEKDTLKFFDHLEKQASEKPNDEKEYELMVKSQTDWLEKNTNYAWQFAALFAQKEGIDLDQIYAEHIRDFLAEHFDKAYDVVFTEGLKDDKNEKPLKAFMIKSLRAIESQTKELALGQTDILKAIANLNENIDLSESRNYFEKEAVKKNELFQKRVITFLKRIDRRILELGRKLDELIKGKVGLVYPYCITLPPPRLDFGKYVERGDILDNLKKDMTDGKRTLLLNGMGGVGKSTIALAYLRRFENDYDHIAWLSQTDNFENMIISAFALQKNLEIELSNQSPKEIVSSVLLSLNNIKGKRLLVLDNVDDTMGSYHHLLPEGWHVLLTSREKLAYNFSIKRIDNLSFKEAKELVDKHYTKAPYTDNELKELCEWLDYHALTLELFSKTLEASLELETVAELYQYLKSNKLDADELQENVFTSHSKEEVMAYAHLIQSFTLAKLEKREIWVLLQFAVLPPLIHQYKDLVEWLSLEGEGKIVFSNDLKNLAKKGWIEREGNSFSMHRMVQTLVKYQEKPDEENTKELVETFTEKLSIDQIKDNPIEKFQWIEYGKFIYESRETDSLHEKISVLANNLALVLQDLGDYQGAKLLLEKALKSDEANYGEKHPTTAVPYHNYGTLLDAMNEPCEGLKWCQKAYQIFYNHLGTSHPNTQTVKSWVDSLTEKCKQ